MGQRMNRQPAQALPITAPRNSELVRTSYALMTPPVQPTTAVEYGALPSPGQPMTTRPHIVSRSQRWGTAHIMRRTTRLKSPDEAQQLACETSCPTTPHIARPSNILFQYNIYRDEPNFQSYYKSYSTKTKTLTFLSHTDHQTTRPPDHQTTRPPDGQE